MLPPAHTKALPLGFSGWNWLVTEQAERSGHGVTGFLNKIERPVNSAEDTRKPIWRYAVQQGLWWLCGLVGKWQDRQRQKGDFQQKKSAGGMVAMLGMRSLLLSR